MHHHLPILLICLLLAACAGERSDRDAGFETPVTTGFAADAANVVEVGVVDDRPVEQVELLAPDGRVYVAYQIQRDRLVAERGGFSPNLGVGVGVAGGSSSRIGTSVGIGFPLGGFDYDDPQPQVVSQARIRVDDLTAYRTSWQDWKLRIRLGTPETGVQFMEVPAPPPPAG